MLRDELKDAMKAAMRAKETRKLATIRLILAAIKERDIAARGQDTNGAAGDDDEQIRAILAKMIKQRRDSITAYLEGGRCELAEQERDEIAIIEGFLPRQLNDDEIRAVCQSAAKDAGAESLKDMGRAMGLLKDRYAGQMDFAKAGKEMRTLLN
ncbi:MAG: GatB/YqeY domain-containing protein [Pseudomonadota bacterium]